MPDEIAIAERIRQSLHLFTPTERRAALALLGTYPVAGLETVAEFARRAEVSAPTVLRFVARLGFASYPEFQRALRNELDKRVQSPLAKTSYGGMPPADGPLAGFRDALIANLDLSFRSLGDSELQAFVTLLSDRRRRVAVLGGRMTDALARLFAAHLAVIRPQVQHLDGQPAAWRDRLLDYGSRDLLVVFDVRRYQDDVVDFARRAAERGVAVLLFTDQWLSPAARHARHVIAARIEAPSRWDSLAALLGTAELVLAAVTEANWPEASRRIAAIDALKE